MRVLVHVTAVLATCLCQNVVADGVYLFYLQNESATTVKIGAKLPPGWVDTPKYPISVGKKDVLADERAYDEVKKSFAFYSCISKRKDYDVKKIRNVALPTWCEDAGWPGPGEWRWLSVDGVKDYRLYACKGKVYVKKKVGGKWKDYASKKYESHAGIGIFWLLIQDDGDLELHSTW